MPLNRSQSGQSDPIVFNLLLLEGLSFWLLSLFTNSELSFVQGLKLQVQLGFKIFFQTNMK